MDKIKFHPWLLHYDHDATTNAYKEIEQGDATRCVCSYCKNFVTVRDDAYPDIIKGLFLKSGIDYTKEFEVDHNCRLKSDRHDYGGVFHFIGKSDLLENVNMNDSSYSNITIGNNKLKMLNINEDFSICITDTDVTFFHDVFIGKPIVEVHFSTQVPWVINEKEPM